MKLYIGTFTRNGESQGIYHCQLDQISGELKLNGLAAECQNPAYLCLDTSLKTLYSVNEVNKFDNKPEGAITAFRISDDGSLQDLGTVMSGSQGPCHLVLHPNGNLLFVSNYSGGGISVLSCNQDGSLKECLLTIPHHGSSINTLRQQEPHPHSVNLSQDGKYLYVPDLGIDKIICYQVEEDEKILKECGQVIMAPGAGPRHFCFHPTGRVAYVINELASTITALAFDRENSDLQHMQTISTLPKDFKGETATAHILAHPNGRFLYGSNRGHDSIAVFAIGGDGRIKLIGTEPTLGKTPRNFTITGNGKFLIVANQDSNSVRTFFIDLDTGLLRPTGSLVEVPSPVCVLSVE